jgi:predicted lipoprotein with Yx(FWY)xxD motif
MFIRALALCLAVGLMTPAAWAFEAPDGIEIGRTEKGETLVDDDGMTLYVFDRDEPFESRCYDRCAANWPPVKARRKDVRIGRFLSVARKDGGYQWTYGGKPLYRWSKDQEKGDITGDGLADVWRIAKP